MLPWASLFLHIPHHDVSGISSKAPHKDYSISSDGVNRLFGVSSAIAIIATTYGNGIVPEIQVQLLCFARVGDSFLLFSVNTSFWESILCAGNSCTPCERENVQGTLYLLYCRDRHFLQRWHLRLLGLWKSSRRHYSEQLFDRRKAPSAEMVSNDDICVYSPTSFSCGRGTYIAFK